MKLCKLLDEHNAARVGCVEGETIHVLPTSAGRLSDVLASGDPRGAVERWLPLAADVPRDTARLLPPIDSQEVWAAGVTYTRSRSARMEESKDAATYYDKVYTADRPELFVKATPNRVVGPDQAIRIRRDARWNVPEPEFTLALSPRLEIVGYTIGNDMSARDIEGENPLYLPQAKIYDQCAGLGPVIALADDFPPRESVGIRLAIERLGATIFRGETSLAAMYRTFEDLVGWLARDNSFPNGAFLMTGTGIVPPHDFSLAAGDIIRIEIDGIGSLRNLVVQTTKP
jgi:2-dehydro-3-deoxy-D-arabinonate dehydratase